MREETRKLLERQLWLDRLKWVATGLSLVVLIAAGIWFTGLDTAVETRHVAGVIESVTPLAGASTQAIEKGLGVDVKLDNGRLVHVMALKTAHPHVGDHVEVAEHIHGSGRVTFTWK